MSASANVPPAVAEILETMLAPDGYEVAVHYWPPDGVGHPSLEIVPTPDACADCLVPKSVLALVIAGRLDAGIELDENDLIYPSDRSADAS